MSFEAIFYEASPAVDFLYSEPFGTPAGATMLAPSEVTVGVIDYRGRSRTASYDGRVGAGTRIRFLPR